MPANKDDSEEEEGKSFQSWRSTVIYTAHVALDQTWGKSKQAYYDADEGDDLDEMREEETEALKIQKEQLAAMDEADFMDEWGTGPGAVSKRESRGMVIYSDGSHISHRMRKLISNLWKMLPRIWMISLLSMLGRKHNTGCVLIVFAFIF